MVLVKPDGVAETTEFCLGENGNGAVSESAAGLIKEMIHLP